MKDLSAFASTLSNFESEYKMGTAYRWVQETPLEQPACVVAQVRHVIIGYRITQIPQMNASDGGGKDAVAGALLRHKAFIDTVCNVFLKPVGNLSGNLELRIQNNVARKTVDCFLVLRLVIADNSTFYSSKRLRDDFCQLIPEEYAVDELSNVELAALLSLGNMSVVEIRKRANMLPVGQNIQAEEMILPPRDLTDWDGVGRFNIPCTPYLEPSSYNLSNLYQMLQNCASLTQIRIALGAAQLFEVEKNCALQYFNMLKGSYAHVPNAELEGYLNAYSKYITSSHLFTIKMQVASESEMAAMLIANSFCAEIYFGNLRPQTVLECFSLREQHASIKRTEWEECNQFFFPFQDEHHEQALIDDDTVAAFMQRQPYLADPIEAMACFRLPMATQAGLPGMVAKATKPFYQPNPRNASREEISIGKIITSGTARLDDASAINYTFPVRDLTKHGLIVGSTGSGKTNTTLNFLLELNLQSIPFLLIEPVKSEYYDELSKNLGTTKLNRFKFSKPFLDNGEANPQYLRFNPLIPMPGISVMQHISYIKGCFTAAFPMHGIMPLILEECIYNLYAIALDAQHDERLLFDANKTPTYLHDQDPGTLEEDQKDTMNVLSLKDLMNQIDTYLNNDELFSEEERKGMGGYLKRRVQRLTKGTLGNSICTDSWVDSEGVPFQVENNLQKIFTEPTVIELEYLADNEEKALIMAFLMTYLFEYRQTQPSLKSIELSQGSNFKTSEHIHITVIEEAHRLLSSGSLQTAGGGEDGITTQDSKSKSISLFIDMLAEIRAKGEGIFIVEQIPTKLVSDVVKNTNLKIMHRITSKEDRQYLGDAMNMNDQQKNYVNSLKTGEAIIFEEQLDHPVFVKMNRFV